MANLRAKGGQPASPRASDDGVVSDDLLQFEMELQAHREATNTRLDETNAQLADLKSSMQAQLQQFQTMMMEGIQQQLAQLKPSMGQSSGTQVVFTPQKGVLPTEGGSATSSTMARCEGNFSPRNNIFVDHTGDKAEIHDIVDDLLEVASVGCNKNLVVKPKSVFNKPIGVNSMNGDGLSSFSAPLPTQTYAQFSANMVNPEAYPYMFPYGIPMFGNFAQFIPPQPPPLMPLGSPTHKNNCSTSFDRQISFNKTPYNFSINTTEPNQWCG
ncbi:uncharacterized protein LOC126795806 [Argentina anserina]|uniref:uncharacterized protein LOC126795806 n=1 Tax=Argentina anserina TaxID=57926 RepID=UPI0021762B3E|nr:uncharacterized protein LOC126795806 [Potentilla anserina]